MLHAALFKLLLATLLLMASELRRIAISQEISSTPLVFVGRMIAVAAKLTELELSPSTASKVNETLTSLESLVGVRRVGFAGPATPQDSPPTEEPLDALDRVTRALQALASEGGES